MAKDNILLVFGVTAFFLYTLWWRWERNEVDQCFEHYLYHDRNEKRDNLK